MNLAHFAHLEQLRYLSASRFALDANCNCLNVGVLFIYMYLRGFKENPSRLALNVECE